MYSDASSSIVRLNIGGDKFCTTVDTLTHREPNSMLAAMFSGRHTVLKDTEGYVFVDRDGKHFRHVLNWLRNGVVPNLTDPEYSELLQEAEYYQLVGLVDGITEVLNRKKDSKEMDTDFTRIEIIKLRSKADRLRGVNLSGLDLSNLELTYRDFSNARLTNVSFSGADLQYAKFWGVVAKNTSFYKAAMFQEANLHGACLAGASLQFSNLEGACLMDCNFRGAYLQSAILVKSNLTNANLEGANLETANLTNANLEGANLKTANLTNANLEGANLKGAKLNNANMKGANLQRANLQDTHLEGSELEGANLLGAIR